MYKEEIMLEKLEEIQNIGLEKIKNTNTRKLLLYEIRQSCAKLYKFILIS